MQLKQNVKYYSFVQLICRLYMKRFKFEVRGQRNIPSHVPFVLAATHRHNIDTWVIGALPIRPMIWLAKSQLWEKKYLWAGKWFFGPVGCIPVYRGNVTRELYELTRRAIKEWNEPVSLYPEEHRRSGDDIGDIKPGAIRIARDNQVPLIPVAIYGTEKRLRSLFKRTRIVVAIGRPIYLEPGARSDEELQKKQLQEAMQRCYDEAMAIATRD